MNRPLHAWLDRTWLGQRLQNIQRRLAATNAVVLEIRLIRNRMEQLMSNLDTLQSAVDRNGAQTALAVTALADQRQKIAALTAAVDAGQIDQTKLAALAASIDASTDAVAQALAPVVNDPETPTGDAEPPAAQNPSTPDPVEVDGAVPAGEPLPDELQA